MITVLFANNQEKIKEIILEILNKLGNTNIYIRKRGDIIEILEKEDIRSMVSLADKVIELEGALYYEKKGMLYKTVLEVIEKPLIECALERAEGNQIKAARILGINRNTIRSKIKKLGINANHWKVA